MGSNPVLGNLDLCDRGKHFIPGYHLRVHHAGRRMLRTDRKKNLGFAVSYEPGGAGNLFFATAYSGVGLLLAHDQTHLEDPGWPKAARRGSDLLGAVDLLSLFPSLSHPAHATPPLHDAPAHSDMPVAGHLAEISGGDTVLRRDQQLPGSAPLPIRWPWLPSCDE